MAAIMLGKSPWGLISGIGAVTGILILVFKDTILSFVASIQITANNLLQIGDWVEMPQFGADGDVLEIALHTVRIQNWDKTIVTIPTYKFIEGSFKNWRGMLESGGRRIMRSIFIDQTSIKIVDDTLLSKIEEIDILKDYLIQKKADIERENNEKKINSKHIINGRQMTNIGCFRAYILAYLKSNPNLRNDMSFMVRQLAPTPDGIPLQVYVFSRVIEWAPYEDIQADIFDHLLAAVPHFDLRVFQNPTDYSLSKLADAKQIN
jgi:miniconductance mechanosensitive channel